jgi:hypothetical protein
MRRSKDRVSLIQLLFARISDLLHFSSVMRVRCLAHSTAIVHLGCSEDPFSARSF